MPRKKITPWVTAKCPFGDKMLELIRRGGYTITEFAQLLEVAPTTVYNLLHGTSAPDAMIIGRLIATFGVSADWLLSTTVYVVCIDSCHIRDAQLVIDDEEIGGDNAVDISPDAFVGVYKTLTAEDAIKQASEECGLPSDVLMIAWKEAADA